jgi:hypothetical protein
MSPESLRAVAPPPARPAVDTIDGYLARLRAELAGSDPALIQDALGNAEEYLRGEQAQRLAAGTPAEEAQIVRRTLERFGTPEEVAEAYRESERRRAQPGPFPAPATRRDDDLGRRVFGVLVDPRAYGALLYMFLALATGIVSFTWAVVGLALSLGLLPLIIGVLVPVAFLASLRGFGVLEGRVVEGLLGERMPRHAPVAQGTLLQRVRGWATDGRTWTTLLYMLLQMPLGILYFTLFTVMLALTLGLAIAPVAQLVTGVPMFVIDRFRMELPLLALPLVWIAAAFDLLVSLHLARALGRLHGRYAKAMLVRG